MEKNSLKHITKLVAIGGSAGSLQVLLRLFSQIPSGFSIPFLVVLHRNVQYESALEELLATRTALRVKEVEEKEKIQAGHVYICPPDYHVLVEKNHSFSLDYSEKVNFSRPSIDVVFKSAAEAYKSHLVALLLSGANADGATGLLHVRQHKGITVVQSPDEAEVSYMPQQAIQLVKPHYVLGFNDMVLFMQGLLLQGQAS
ncbi:chemotaxis protein CheB [Foetidibacter luteolus]|uniref:chemotaxis protein CheB n=1 Tax=Foetidibacter luteolus TaxID=2608880 RepID=UPI00129BC5F5|nr:chemotaxis protein CheB [Foetidibacter luteolus]